MTPKPDPDATRQALRDLDAGLGMPLSAIATTPEDAIVAIANEWRRACGLHGPLASHHEAQSVIAEEFDELTCAVWYGIDQRGRPSDPHEEAVQLAAMCLRYLVDVPRRTR